MQSSATSSSGRDDCPVLSPNSQYKNPAVYDVYGQNLKDPSRSSNRNPALEALKGAGVMDPRNNMPLEPNQLPCPGQQKQLPTDRAVSGIPKGGVSGTWTFPSPQMVYNGASLQAQQKFSLEMHAHLCSVLICHPLKWTSSCITCVSMRQEDRTLSFAPTTYLLPDTRH